MLTIEDKIYRLLWDKRFIVIPANISDSINVLLIKNPSIQDRNFALFLKERTYRECLENGVPTQEQIVESAQINGYWSQEDANFFREVDEQIKDNEELLKNQKNLIKRKKLQKSIDELKRKKDDLRKRYEHLMSNSAEYLANEIYIFYLMQKLVYHINGQLLWSSEEEFNLAKNQNLNLINYIANQLLRENMLSISEIREIARSIEWRLFWTLCRESLIDIFAQPLSSFNTNQKLLVYWSRIYDSVYEDPEKPDNSVIDNDEELDAWLLDRSNGKNEKTQLKTPNNHNEQMMVLDGYYSDQCICGVAKIKSLGHGEKPRHANNCLWGTWVKYSRAEKDKMASQIYNKNAPVIRQLINKEMNIIERSGTIEEQYLRDKKDRAILGSESKIFKVK